MVYHREAALDACFAALAHPTRRAILRMLTGGPRAVSDLAEAFPVTLPAIGRHLMVLEDAGLVRRTKRGRVRWCELIPSPLATADEWLHHYRSFWTRRLEALDDYLQRTRDDPP